jgi:hypothetical protein
VHFVEIDHIKALLRDADGWINKCQVALGGGDGGRADVRHLELLITAAEDIPVALDEQVARLRGEVGKAREWVKRVRESLPPKVCVLNISVYVQSMFSLCSVYVQCEGFGKLTFTPPTTEAIIEGARRGARQAGAGQPEGAARRR